jgi:hypothetical protein
MRRLEYLSQLLERLSSLEEAVRTGKSPAGATPGGAAATAGAKTRSTTGAAPLTAPSDSPRSANSPSGISKAAGSLKATSDSGSFTGAATKAALEIESRFNTEINISSEIVCETPVGTGATYSPDQAEMRSEGSEETNPATRSEIEQIKAALEKRRKMFLVTALVGARHASLEGNELCLEFAPDARHLRDTLAKSENVKILREVCKEITARDLGVRFVIADGEAGVSGAPISREETERREQQLEKQNLRETAEKDPVVQQMLRTFRGEIVDVKRVDGKS